jgi:TRAP transporter TAXI family solute receptor
MPLVARLLALLLFVAGPVAAQEIVLLTGGTSGVYYPLGLALKKILERDVAGAKVSVVATQASVENLNMIQQGKGVLGFAQGDILTQAWKGDPEAGFPSSRTKIRLIGAAYPNYVHVVARRDAKVRSLADLVGKRVSVGAARSGNELNARALLGAANVSYADLLQVEYLEYGQSVELMVKGQLDAVIVSAGLGVAAVQRAASQIPVDIVPIEARLIERTHGMFYALPIPPNAYAGQTQPVPTAALNNYFVTTIDAPDELVYRITKAIFGNVKELQAAHVAAADISADKALAARPIDVHPGALRWFREAGLLR